MREGQRWGKPQGSHLVDEAGVLMQGENQIGVCMSSLNVSANDVCLLTTVGPERSRSCRGWRPRTAELVLTATLRSSDRTVRCSTALSRTKPAGPDTGRPASDGIAALLTCRWRLTELCASSEPRSAKDPIWTGLRVGPGVYPAHSHVESPVSY